MFKARHLLLATAAPPAMPRRKFTIAEHMFHDRHAEDLDWERAEGPDPRDPRHDGGPCAGQHQVFTTNCRVANQHMVKYRCSVCSLELLYVPKVSSSGDYRRATKLQTASSVAGAHSPKGRAHNPSGIPEDEPVPTPEPKKDAGKKSTEKTEKPKTKATSGAPGPAGAKDTSGAQGPAGAKWEGVNAEPPTCGGEAETTKPKVAAEPPTWDGEVGTLKAYKRMVKKWLEENEIDSASEEGDDAPTEEKGSTTDVSDATGEWALLQSKLQELACQVGVPKGEPARRGVVATAGKTKAGASSRAAASPKPRSCDTSGASAP